MGNKASLDTYAATIAAGTPGATSYAVTATTIPTGKLRELIQACEASGGRAEMVAGVLNLFYNQA